MKVLICLLVATGLFGDELETDPARNFSVMIPKALLPCELTAGNLACPTDKPLLTIEVKKAPSGASVEMMALLSEDALRKKPNYKLVKKEKILVDKNWVLVQTMTFNNLGNVTLPVLVRTFDAVLGDKTFELEMACNQNTCADLIPAFDALSMSLRLANKTEKQKLPQSPSASGNDFKNLLKGFKFE